MNQLGVEFFPEKVNVHTSLFFAPVLFLPLLCQVCLGGLTKWRHGKRLPCFGLTFRNLLGVRCSGNLGGSGQLLVCQGCFT